MREELRQRAENELMLLKIERDRLYLELGKMIREMPDEEIVEYLQDRDDRNKIHYLSLGVLRGAIIVMSILTIGRLLFNHW